MGKRFDLEFSDERHTVVTAELLDEAAPIACENLWASMTEPRRASLHHGRHCAAELWCYLPVPAEPTPFENSTVFPATGDILYYHFIQPPTRDGRWICDLGIFYAPGQSRLPSGWLPGNVVARVRGGEAAIRQLELIGADLLHGRSIELILRQRADLVENTDVIPDWPSALSNWLTCWDELPETASEPDVTRLCAAAETFSHALVEELDRHRASDAPIDRMSLRTGARRVAALAATWRFATDSRAPDDWQGPVVTYWRALVQHQIDGEPMPAIDRAVL